MSFLDLVFKHYEERINEYFDRKVDCKDYEAIEQFVREYLLDN